MLLVHIFMFFIVFLIAVCVVSKVHDFYVENRISRQAFIALSVFAVLAVVAFAVGGLYSIIIVLLIASLFVPFVLERFPPDPDRPPLKPRGHMEPVTFENLSNRYVVLLCFTAAMSIALVVSIACFPEPSDVLSLFGLADRYMDFKANSTRLAPIDPYAWTMCLLTCVFGMLGATGAPFAGKGGARNVVAAVLGAVFGACCGFTLAAVIGAYSCWQSDEYLVPVFVAAGCTVASACIAFLMARTRQLQEAAKAEEGDAPLFAESTANNRKRAIGAVAALIAVAAIALGCFALSQSDFHLGGKHPQTVTATVKSISAYHDGGKDDGEVVSETVAIELDCGNPAYVLLTDRDIEALADLKEGDVVEVTSWDDEITDRTTFVGYMHRVD